MTTISTSRRRTLVVVALVGVGGFAGANLRYAVSLVVPGLGGTFLVNSLGCLALGVLLYRANLAGMLSEETGFVVVTGFLSSFTTYSTFALETVQSATPVAIAYVVATYACGVVAVLVGGRVAVALEDVVR
jgi:CrcB protein